MEAVFGLLRYCRQPKKAQNGEAMEPSQPANGEASASEPFNVLGPDADLHQIVVIGGGAGGLELVTSLGDSLGKNARQRSRSSKITDPFLEAAPSRNCCRQHGSGTYVHGKKLHQLMKVSLYK